MSMRYLRMKGPTLKNRVAHAYHDYGRLCSAHPVSCLSMSVVMMFMLSYPAAIRFRSWISSPIEVYWSNKVLEYPKEASATPYWILGPPTVFLQQVVIRGTVEPWNSLNMTSEQAVRGPLSRSFRARELILTHEGVDASCFHISQPHSASLHLPQQGCLLLSPAAFWNNMEREFIRDSNVLNTIFEPECSPTMCLRDMLLGLPTGLTGIKKRFQTNRKRSIDYSLTLFLARYDPLVRNSLRSRFADEFQLVESKERDENTFVHVYYRPRKYFSDYFPLATSYLILMLYLYYSARKFEMVASRWGLAFAAACTVAATLLMTTGICAHLDMNPSLWGAEIFPYIALILGLENILCITRSVVYTPPSLDVSSRIAHGLSQEGYSLCKYFVMELTFLAIGYMTGVSEIQEFCTFASVGLVIDFYMQLFFYAPCLTFDLQRLCTEDKQRFTLRLFTTEIPQLRNYPPVRCPMRKIWPRLFDFKRQRKRTVSDSQLDDRYIHQVLEKKERRRSISVSKSVWTSNKDIYCNNSSTSHRLRLLYFVTRTRIFQRSIMVIFAVWTVWLAFFVHSQRNSDVSRSFSTLGFGVSNRILGTAPQQWDEWQRRTFKWWPVLFGEYNKSLCGHYITFLPPVILSTKVNSSDPLLQHQINTTENKGVLTNTTVKPDIRKELRSRIFWLETQLKVYLAMFWLLLLTSVISFIMYACFWGRWRNGWTRNNQKELPVHSFMEGKTHRNKFVVEALPIVFSGHRFPIDNVEVCSSNRIVSSCQEGKVCVWNAETGERLLKLNRMCVSPHQNPISVPPEIWCTAVKHSVAVLGCSDGSLEIACLDRNKLIAIYKQSKIGVIHVQLFDNKVIVARLDGTIELIELILTTNGPLRVTSIVLLRSLRAHLKPISQIVTNLSSIVSACHDHTIKVFDINSAELKYILHAHNAPVTNICIDHETNMLFSSCDEGVICWWNMASGELIKSIDTSNSGRVELASTSEYLLGYSSDGSFRLWSKENGQLISRIAQPMTEHTDGGLISRGLVVMGCGVAATSCGQTVTFWNLQHKAIFKQVDLGSSINRLRSLSDRSVLCQCSNMMYRVNVPLVRIS